MHKFKNGRSGSAISVRVISRASINQISEILEDGTIKVKIAAPPVEGKANSTLIKFLADVFEIPQSNLEIVAGVKGKNKLISIYNLTADEVQEKINNAFGKAKTTAYKSKSSL
jgi:uncharacterized protein (TIGR00251 family)